MDTNILSQKEIKPEVISPPDSPILTPREREINPVPKENNPTNPKPEIEPTLPPDIKPLP
jgi:hypothetical protein